MLANEPLNQTPGPGSGSFRLTCCAHQSAGVCPPQRARCTLSAPVQVSAGVRRTGSPYLRIGSFGELESRPRTVRRVLLGLSSVPSGEVVSTPSDRFRG